MKIIFMGSPDFAVPTLESLLNSLDHQVVAIFTQDPKPRGRGLNIQYSSVHEIAIRHNIATYTPKTLRSEEVSRLIDSIEADVIVVVAYGFILPSYILKSKKYGCLNIHPSSLPRHRGAAPLQRTILHGDKETSIIIMQMDEGCDSGDIILEEKFSLHEHITLPELHDKCSAIGADLLIKTLANIDSLPRIPQKTTGVTFAPKLTKAEGLINWSDGAHEIDCKIRAMNPWPGAYFKYDGKIIKVHEANYLETSHNLRAGSVLPEDCSVAGFLKNKFEVACGSGTLNITKLQQEGKKTLSIIEFLRGTHIISGTIL